MTESGQNNSVKIFWTPEEVYEHLKSIPKGQKLEIKTQNIYCTADFTWNEILKTKSRFITLPSLEVLRNLKAITEILQVYRTILDKKIDINSGWRTPSEQQKLINMYKRGELSNMPSETSLHLEGLALDVTVKGMPQSVFQSLVNDTLIGEAELTDPTYTHIGLPHYSKGYLKRNNIYSDYIYRNPYIDVSKLSSVESDKIIKRMEPKYWKKVPSTFNSGNSQKLFSGKLSTDIYINPEQSESVNNTNTPVNKNNFTNNHSISGNTATGQSHSGMIIQEFTNSGKNVGTYRDSMNITNDNSENFNPNFTNYGKNSTNIPTGYAADLRDLGAEISENDMLSNTELNSEANSEEKYAVKFSTAQEPEWSFKVLENGDKVYRTQYANPDYGFPVTWEIREKKKKYPPSYFELYEVVEDIVVSLLDDFIRFMGYDEVHKL